MMLPISFFLLVFDDIIKIIPISARIGEKDSGFNNLIQTLLLSIPTKLRIQAVKMCIRDRK